MTVLFEVCDKAARLLQETAERLALCFDDGGDVDVAAVREHVPQIAVALSSVGRGFAAMADSEREVSL